MVQDEVTERLVSCLKDIYRTFGLQITSIEVRYAYEEKEIDSIEYKAYKHSFDEE